MGALRTILLTILYNCKSIIFVPKRLHEVVLKTGNFVRAKSSYKLGLETYITWNLTKFCDFCLLLV